MHVSPPVAILAQDIGLEPSSFFFLLKAPRQAMKSLPLIVHSADSAGEVRLVHSPEEERMRGCKQKKNGGLHGHRQKWGTSSRATDAHVPRGGVTADSAGRPLGHRAEAKVGRAGEKKRREDKVSF